MVIISELEMEEFSRRMSVLTEEEQIIAEKYIKESIMFSELEKRSRKKDCIISLVEEAIRKERI